MGTHRIFAIGASLLALVIGSPMHAPLACPQARAATLPAGPMPPRLEPCTILLRSNMYAWVVVTDEAGRLRGSPQASLPSGLTIHHVPACERWHVEVINRGGDMLQESLREICEQLGRVEGGGLSLPAYGYLTDEDMAAIGATKTMHELTISGSWGGAFRPADTVTDAGIARLGELTQLEILSVDSLDGATDRGLARALQPLTQLRELTVNMRGLGKHTLRELRRAPSLRRLSLHSGERMSWWQSELRLKPRMFRGMSQLEALALPQNTGPDEEWSRLPGMLPALKELDVMRAFLAIRDVEHLRGLEALSLPELQVIGAPPWQHLARLPLRRLSLFACESLDDEGLLALSASVFLEVLDVRSCPRLSTAALEEFRARRPRCQLLR